MSYLLDTNVVSELGRTRKNRGVLDWLAATSHSDHHISVLTVGELLRGVYRLRQRGDHRQADAVQEAVNGVRADYADRIVRVSIEVAEVWARQPLGRPVPTVDALIGATAAARGWTMVTRNTKDFDHIGVPLINPFTDEEAP